MCRKINGERSSTSLFGNTFASPNMTRRLTVPITESIGLRAWNSLSRNSLLSVLFVSFREILNYDYAGSLGGSPENPLVEGCSTPYEMYVQNTFFRKPHPFLREECTISPRNLHYASTKFSEEAASPSFW